MIEPSEIVAVSLPTDKRFVDLTGETFDRWTVISYAGKRGHNQTWNCVCQCGTAAVVIASNLVRNLTLSCGCWNRESTINRFTTHGHAGRDGGKKLSVYNIWCAMKERCHSPNSKNYPRYGGQGISVCKGWMDFANFFADMGPKPSPEHSLDRYPNQRGNYEPGNVRWATRVEQANNTKSNRIITYKGVTDTMANVASHFGVPYKTIQNWANRKNAKINLTVSD